MSKSRKIVRVTPPSRTSLPPRPAIRSWPPPPIKVLSWALPMNGVVVRAAQHVVDSERVGQGQGERAGHHGLRPGLAEIDRDPGRGPPRNRARRLPVPAASTIVWLPLEPPLKANVSSPPPPTSESLPVPANKRVGAA